MAVAIANACKTTEGATDADIKQLLQHNMPTTNTAKCMHACIMEAIGLINDGKPSLENAVSLAGIASNDNPTVLKLVQNIADACQSINEPDRCETAYKLLECSVRVSKANGFDPKEMLEQ